MGCGLQHSLLQAHKSFIDAVHSAFLKAPCSHSELNHSLCFLSLLFDGFIAVNTVFGKGVKASL